MEWYDFLKDKLNIDPIIVALVLLSGLFQKKYLAPWKWVNDGRWDEGLKTLAVSCIVSIVYIILTIKELKKGLTDGETLIIPYAKYFISYFAATSLYDMVIRPFVNWVKKKTGATDTANNQTKNKCQRRTN